MTKREHRVVWRRYAKSKKLPQPCEEWVEFQYCCLGVEGRAMCSKEFAWMMFEDDSCLAEELFWESEAMRN